MSRRIPLEEWKFHLLNRVEAIEHMLRHDYDEDLLYFACADFSDLVRSGEVPDGVKVRWDRSDEECAVEMIVNGIYAVECTKTLYRRGADLSPLVEAVERMCKSPPSDSTLKYVEFLSKVVPGAPGLFSDKVKSKASFDHACLSANFPCLRFLIRVSLYQIYSDELFDEFPHSLVPSFPAGNSELRSKSITYVMNNARVLSNLKVIASEKEKQDAKFDARFGDTIYLDGVVPRIREIATYANFLKEIRGVSMLSATAIIAEYTLKSFDGLELTSPYEEEKLRRLAKLYAEVAVQAAYRNAQPPFEKFRERIEAVLYSDSGIRFAAQPSPGYTSVRYGGQGVRVATSARSESGFYMMHLNIEELLRENLNLNF